MKLLIILAILAVAYLVYRGLASSPEIEKPTVSVETVEEIEPKSGKTLLKIAGIIVVLSALFITAAVFL
jgi:hypothetical protein